MFCGIANHNNTTWEQFANDKSESTDEMQITWRTMTSILSSSIESNTLVRDDIACGSFRDIWKVFRGIVIRLKNLEFIFIMKQRDQHQPFRICVNKLRGWHIYVKTFIYLTRSCQIFHKIRTPGLLLFIQRGKQKLCIEYFYLILLLCVITMYINFILDVKLR